MRTHIFFLIGYMVLFGILFVVAAYGILTNTSQMDIGLEAHTTNLLIMAFSFFGIVKSFYHIAKI